MIDSDSISTVGEASRATSSINQQLSPAMRDPCGQVNTSKQYKGHLKPHSGWNVGCVVTGEHQTALVTSRTAIRLLRRHTEQHVCRSETWEHQR